LRFGNLSSRIVGLRIVAGDGTVVAASASEAADVLDVARVGIGALGVLSTVTIQCVPSFNLHAVEQPELVDEVLERWDDEIEGNDHFEFFWVPGTRWALTKRNRRTQEPPVPRSRWRAARDDYLINNLAFALTCRVGRVRPDLIPRVAKMMPSTGRSVYVAPSHTVFASPRLVHFYEMEYAIPREHLVEALNRVRTLVRSLGVPISFPVEVRIVAADDIPLSTGLRARDRVHRGARLSRYLVRPVLPRRRAHHGRLRRASSLGQAPLPGRRHARPALPPLGRLPGAARSPRPRRRLQQPLPRPHPGSDERPGVAPPGVVDREAALAHEGASACEQRVALERVEQRKQR
jgi:FAD/FMN-containing dehydrogenase